jgi:hypothetical protein
MERPFNFVCIVLIREYVSGEICKNDERNKLQLLAIQPAELRRNSQASGHNVIDNLVRDRW